eukprot:1987127-Alexandrium_andersonii.AAC.1
MRVEDSSRCGAQRGGYGVPAGRDTRALPRAVPEPGGKRAHAKVTRAASEGNERRTPGRRACARQGHPEG